MIVERWTPSERENELFDEIDMLRERIAEGHRLLLKMCAAQDLMPDDVAAWLGYTDHYARTHPERRPAPDARSTPAVGTPPVDP
jgi:hypothetical protein